MPMSSFTIGLLVRASGGGAPEAYATTGVASTRVRRGRRGARGLLPLIEDQRGPAANGAVLAQVEERQTRGGERVLVGAPGEARAQVSLAAREGLADAACDEQALGVDAVHDDGESRGEGFRGLGPTASAVASPRSASSKSPAVSTGRPSRREASPARSGPAT